MPDANDDTPFPPAGDAYIGSADPYEASRLDAQQGGALDELRAALTLHAVAPGPRVLELGCGSGVFTAALLAALPGARITATDRDEALLTHARRALATDIQRGRVAFERADAANLPYAARDFDLVACRCVLMHQPDPLLVVAEMYRVLAVGGIAIAIEPDWGARALYPDSDALAELLALARVARPYGFPDLLLGRSLYALFRAAGFVEMRLRATAFVETASLRSTEPSTDTSDLPSAPPAHSGPARLLNQGRALLRRAGLADDAAIDALIARLDTIQRHPEYCSAGLDFSIAAIKPAATVPAGARFR